MASKKTSLIIPPGEGTPLNPGLLEHALKWLEYATLLDVRLEHVGTRLTLRFSGHGDWSVPWPAVPHGMRADIVIVAEGVVQLNLTNRVGHNSFGEWTITPPEGVTTSGVTLEQSSPPTTGLEGLTTQRLVVDYAYGSPGDPMARWPRLDVYFTSATVWVVDSDIRAAPVGPHAPHQGMPE